MLSIDDKQLFGHIFSLLATESIQIAKTGSKQDAFYIIRNTDRSARWLFPAEQPKPYFLELYNSASLKAQLFSMIVRVLFLLGLMRLICREKIFILNWKQTNLAKQINLTKGFCIFSGTAGANRKAVVFVECKKQGKYYLKIPLGENALNLVQHEAKALMKIDSVGFNAFEYPKPEMLHQQILKISHIKPKRYRSKSKTIGSGHLSYIKDLLQKTQQNALLKETSFYLQLKQGIQVLKTNPSDFGDLDGSKATAIAKVLIDRFKNLERERTISVSLAHADFTPWNCFDTGSKLHIYDWEMMQTDFPAMFDLFHFIFQTELLLNQANFKQIEKTWLNLRSDQEIKQIAKTFSVDLPYNQMLYNLYNSTYYLSKFKNQPKPFIQAHWAVDAWFDAWVG